MDYIPHLNLKSVSVLEHCDCVGARLPAWVGVVQCGGGAGM